MFLTLKNNDIPPGTIVAWSSDTDAPAFPPLSEAEVKALQRDTVAVLLSLVLTPLQSRPTRHMGPWHPVQIAFPFDIHASVFLICQETPPESQGSLSHYVLGIKGTAHEMFLALLLFSLTQEPPNRILRCPECTRLFYRVRKQAYCSRRCVNRATVRTWRATENGKQQERGRAQKRHREKIAPRRVTPKRVSKTRVE